jgi:hypothetical protein
VAPPADEVAIETTLECRVDDERRVHSRIRKISFKGVPPGSPLSTEFPVPAEFLLLAVASSGAGG